MLTKLAVSVLALAGLLAGCISGEVPAEFDEHLGEEKGPDAGVGSRSSALGGDAGKARPDVTPPLLTNSGQAPSAVKHAFGRAGDVQQITVWAASQWDASRRCVAEKRWNTVTRSWSSWSCTPGNTTWSGDLTTVGWKDAAGRQRINGFAQAFPRGTNVPLPWAVGPVDATRTASGTPTGVAAPTTRWAELPPPAGHAFYMGSAMTWHDGRNARINVFGSQEGDSQGNLTELYWDGGSWRWTQHPVPPGQQWVSVGRQAAVWDAVRGQGFVLVRGFSFSSSQPDGIYNRFFDGSSWSWQDLGRPRGRFLSVPLVLFYWTGATQSYVTVFVTAEDANGFPHLFTKRHNGTSWETNWQDHGEVPLPPLPYGLTRQDAQYLLNRTAVIDSAVVWHEGATLRINLFGTYSLATEGTTSTSHVSSHLINYFWDGSRWSFGETLAPPDGADQLAVGSAMVIEQGSSDDRISVFACTATGIVWERVYTIRNGVHYGWRWEELR